MDYEVFILVKAIGFLSTERNKEGTKLLFEIERIGRDPFKDPDFSDRGDEGNLHGVILNAYAVLYYVDHAVKSIYAVDVTYADHI